MGAVPEKFASTEDQHITDPKISFIMITARRDYPYDNRPDLHVFEPTLECFKKQTMMDFEWVIIDALYEQRKDYFKDMKLPFKVKHVPALPNLWIEQGLPGICTQYNKGIIYADGKLIFFTGDSHMVQPDFMENLWVEYQNGFFPLAWYSYDHQYEDALTTHPLRAIAPVQYDILGFTGEKSELEHRYLKVFKDNNIHHAHVNWDWWFGCSSASLEAMLKINGFDQKFDGDQMLLDCDVGSRLDLAGYGIRFAMFRNIYLIKIPSDRNWNPAFTKKNVTIKCNLPLIWISRYFKQYKANSMWWAEQGITWIKETWCPTLCPMSKFCQENHPWQYPFEHKDGYEGHNSSKEWFEFWKEHQVLIDLTVEREKRLNGDPKYKTGTFIEACK